MVGYKNVRGGGSGWARYLIALTVLMSLVLAACGGQAGDSAETGEESPAGDQAAEESDAPEEEAAPDETREVTLFLPLPVLTIAMFPAVVAEHQGFFADEGLDVEIVTAGGSSLAVQQMAAGAGDAGLLTSGSVVNAVAEDQDFVAVHDFILRPMFDLVVPADSPVESYEDLAGENVAVDGLEAGEIPELRGDLATAGLQEDEDYTFVALGDDHALAFEQVGGGRAGALSLAYNERVVIEGAGYDFRVLEPPYDVDDARPAIPLVVTREFLDADPEAVVGLGRALNKAIVFSHANPDATLAIMKEAFPEEHDDEDFARTYLDAGLELSDPGAPTVGEGRFGEMPLDGWNQLAELLLDDPAQFPVDDHVTNEFIDEMNDFDVEAVQTQAEESGLTYP